MLPAPESHYVAGRSIGDEFRYILERKYAKKYPGNMLKRPSLLLNPWPLRKTDADRQIVRTGGLFGGSGSKRSYGGRAAASKQGGAEASPRRQAGGLTRHQPVPCKAHAECPCGEHQPTPSQSIATSPEKPCGGHPCDEHLRPVCRAKVMMA